MATYEFRCEQDGVVTLTVPMGEVGPTAPCPACGRAARRVYSAPQLRLGDGRARAMLDATTATADRPAVVGHPVGGRARRPRPAADPRTAKLPPP
ncbi:zinc ribbon domain-containing protein [Intrasporangium sp.]|uniref:FmdB family zinc ribbon protein n=1 Tax=Intrasporangium sp. TaxID=1925024 RepID=UPI003221D94B